MAASETSTVTKRSNKPKKSMQKSEDSALKYSSEELLGFYKVMLLIRRFEEKAGQMYGMGLIGGFCHLYIGQEAVVTGVQAALEEQDTVITTYRDHGHMLACGMEPRGVMAELTGRRDGYSKGKGGSMHMFSREKGFFGGHGIVAAQVPIGAGLAFAHKYNGNKNVSITYFGDGAANQGQVYESYNIASLWKLPVIFVIENNKYGMGTSVNRSSAGDNLSDRGKAYGIKSEIVDGMDIIAVRDAAIRAIEYCRSGKGPYILEMKTYRYRGHSMSDPAKYRTRDEVEKIRKTSDPIENIKILLNKMGVEDKALKDIDVKIKSKIADAAKFAQDSPEPSEAELYTDITIN